VSEGRRSGTGVTFPRGFGAAGVRSGLKRSGRLDLGLLAADAACAAAGAFTTNAFAAAPVRLSRGRLADGRARAVLVNSGQANAATGPAGERDAEAATAAAAEALGAPPSEILGSSTGVIGEPIPMAALLSAVPRLVDALSPEGGESFARAIMTTDTVPKQAQAEAKQYRVGGAAKGVGMIAPSLATMLAFFTTDAPMSAGAVRHVTMSVLRPAFEALTVDACPSTNDSVVVLASGVAGGPPAAPGSAAWPALTQAFAYVADSLVRQLAADAEGASRVLIVGVTGARSDDDARAVAKAVAGSPLVKTAAFGADPNPGRIVQAVGSAGVPLDPRGLHVAIGGAPIVLGGVIEPAYFKTGGARPARCAMTDPEIRLDIVVGDGPGSSRALGCDLSYEYVRINGEYTT
jgi:glutamate N-acetyltransferase / amino-acid N-acetyltransferase